MAALSTLVHILLSNEDQKTIDDFINYYRRKGNTIQSLKNLFTSITGTSLRQKAEKTLTKYFFYEFNNALKAKKSSAFVLKCLIQIDPSNDLSLETQMANCSNLTNLSNNYKKLFANEYDELLNCFTKLVINPNNSRFINSSLPEKFISVIKKPRTFSQDDLNEIIKMKKAMSSLEL